jgi:hypothetical protein
LTAVFDLSSAVFQCIKATISAKPRLLLENALFQHFAAQQQGWPCESWYKSAMDSESLRKREIKAWLTELRYASKRSDFAKAGRRIRAHLRRLGHKGGSNGAVKPGT